MSSLRKLKRKEAVPQMNKAKKIAEKVVKKEMIVGQMYEAKRAKINKQCVGIFNTCAFDVLKNVFRYSAQKCCRLSARMGNISECIRTGFVHPFEIILNIQHEIGWEYPRRKVNDLKCKDNSVVSKADAYIDLERERSFEQMEIMWIETLRLEEGFSRIRCARFIRKVRESITKMTVEKANQINDWLASRGIEFSGYDESLFKSERYGDAVC